MAIVTNDVNVKFNSVLDDVVVLRTDGSTKQTVVLWDLLPAGDQALLTSIIDDLGGDAPLTAPVAGFASIGYTAIAGGNATGLDPLATATSGTATINLGAAKVGGDDSGLVASGTATAGYQVVDIVPSFANGTSAATGLADTKPGTAGVAYVTANAAVLAADTAVLAASAGTYYFKVTVDGGEETEYDITVPAADQSFTAIAALLDGAAGLSDAGVDVTFDDAGNRFVFTRTAIGSSVDVTAGTTGTDIFVQIAADNPAVGSFANTTVPGLKPKSTFYTATITVDGVDNYIGFVGSDAQTVGTLLSLINDQLGGSAIATFAAGDIKVTSATTGASSTVAIVDDTLFAGLVGTATNRPAVPGAANAGTTKTYTAIVEVDGVSHRVSFTGAAGTTLADVVTEIDNDLGTAASVAITGGDIVITSGTTGPTSKVRVFDTGWLFASLVDYTGVSYVDGVSPTTYTAVFTVDGVDVPVSVVGSDAQTFTALVSAVNADLGASATAAISGDAIVVTSATTGAASSVVLSADNLFSKTIGYKSARSVAGAADLVDALTALRMPNGTSGIQYFPTKVVPIGRPVKPVAGSVPKTIDHIYWGGVGPDWRYFNDDSAV